MSENGETSRTARKKVASSDDTFSNTIFEEQTFKISFVNCEKKASKIY